MKLLLNTNRWLAIGLASVIAVACGGGGGGGGSDTGGGGDGGEVVVLPSYDYQLVSAADDPILVTAPLLDPGDITLRLFHDEGGSLFGSYSVEDGTFTVDEGSALSVWEVGTQMALYGDFSIDVTTTWVFPPDGPPTQGAFTVLGAFRMVEVEVTAEGALRLAYSDVTPITDEVILSFEELDAVMDDPDTPEWQKWAIFALQIGADFVPELAAYGVSGFDLIVPEIADASPVSVPCDAFSSIGLAVPAPPPSIPDEGTLVFSWVDDSNDGEVGPADSFDTDMSFCLMVMPPLEDEQLMLNGSYSLNNFTEVIENNTVVRIGFEGESPAGRPGGIVFDDFQRYEVYDADGGGPGTTAVVHLGATVNGRLTLVLTEPAN